MQKLRLAHHRLPNTDHPQSFFVYVALIFLAFHYFFIVYINSNFLSTFLSESYIGYLYILGSLANIAVLIKAPAFLRKLGNFRVAIIMTVLEMFALFLLGYSHSVGIIAFAFILQHAVNPVILYCLDILLEKYSKVSDTGRTRGIFLTILNTPPIIATIVTGFLLENHSFSIIYYISASLLIPLLIIFFLKFRNFRDPVYKKVAIREALSRFSHNIAVRDIFIDNVLLQVFYAVMTIYLPIYMNQVIGFSLGEISFIFAFMLLPFIILEIPIGRITDTKYGSKEFLILGFVIMSASMAIIPFIHSASILTWITVLVCTRIGAAIVEITTESYFFKHVQSTDADMIGVFRMSHSIAFVIMPVIGILLLKNISMQSMIMVFALLIGSVGLRYAWKITDTV